MAGCVFSPQPTAQARGRKEGVRDNAPGPVPAGEGLVGPSGRGGLRGGRCVSVDVGRTAVRSPRALGWWDAQRGRVQEPCPRWNGAC